MTQRGLKANEWIGHIQDEIKGKGGGKDLSAQAVGSNISSLEKVMAMGIDYACQKLGIKRKSTPKSDVRTGSLVEKLNKFLSECSYIEGFTPSQSDVVVFEAVGQPPVFQYTHVLRWYNHIKSYGKESSTFPGVKKSLEQLGLGNGKDSTKNEEDFDLFGSDEEEDAEAEKLKKERLEKYAIKKQKKPVLIAKSNIILDVKPWDDETDMKEMESVVRSVQTDGLMWGASKLVPLAYGIKKLQICCVVEDDKVGTDFLEDSITKFEDLVQSVDIAAFNKV